GRDGSRLGGAGENRADADIIRAIADSLAGLIEVMGADAEQFFQADDFAGFGSGEVFLAEVYAISVGKNGDVGPIVDDGEDAMATAEIDEEAGTAEEFAGIEVFLAQLQAIGPAEDGLLGRFQPGAAAERFGDEDIEPH